MNLTAYDVASRFLGLKEGPGAINNPLIIAMLQLDNSWVSNDEVPWCSAFVNYVAWLLALPRSKSLAARSWLAVGEPVALPSDARMGNDIVILQRGTPPQPGPAVLDAPGHVGFFAGFDEVHNTVRVLAGNQGDAVTYQTFPGDKILGIRRLA